MTVAKGAKPRAAKAAAAVRSSATKAATATTETARDFARKTAAGVEANPVGVLAGGIALGAVIGALVPRSKQEAKLLAPVGKRISDTTRGAIDAAKDTAKAEFDVLGFSRNAARDQVGKMLGGVIKTLATAGTAAVLSAKAKPAAEPAPAPAATPEAAAGPKTTAKKAKTQA
ncbi:hypothetical protein AB5I39_02110 [Sphingomonas sp. MMS24-J45]|uniref:hypothetical protein n=1 Tax=Sphingomonas sp. MMS24-J45 TaxID=3238806 RepID=UPI0038505699